MTSAELTLTLCSAALHALWNFWLKGARDRTAVAFASGYVFVLLGAPLLGTAEALRALRGATGLYVALSALIHLAYRALLAATYDRADLSQAYPVIRSAPIPVALLAAAFLGERISAAGWLGIVLTVAGIQVLYLRELRGAGRGGGPAAWALVTMLSVAAYSIVDKLGVVRGALSPAAFFYAFNLGTMVLFSLTLLRGGGRRVWRAAAAEPARVLAVGLVEPLSYILILFAFRTAQVSYVVSVRQVSVIVAALLGAMLLREPAGRGRVLGSAMIVAGVALLQLWG